MIINIQLTPGEIKALNRNSDLGHILNVADFVDGVHVYDNSISDRSIEIIVAEDSAIDALSEFKLGTLSKIKLGLVDKIMTKLGK